MSVKYRYLIFASLTKGGAEGVPDWRRVGRRRDEDKHSRWDSCSRLPEAAWSLGRKSWASRCEGQSGAALESLSPLTAYEGHWWSRSAQREGWKGIRANWIQGNDACRNTEILINWKSDWLSSMTYWEHLLAEAIISQVISNNNPDDLPPPPPPKKKEEEKRPKKDTITNKKPTKASEEKKQEKKNIPLKI